MTKRTIAALALLALGASSASLAQTTTDKPRTPQQQQAYEQALKRCDTMTGTQRDTCLREAREKAGSLVEQSKPQNDPATREMNKGTGGVPPR